MPGGDKVMLGQLMMSVTCQVVRDSQNLSDSEKLDRLERVNQQILQLMRPQPAAFQIPEFRIVVKTGQLGADLLHESGTPIAGISASSTIVYSLGLTPRGECESAAPLSHVFSIQGESEILQIANGLRFRDLIASPSYIFRRMIAVLERHNDSLCEIRWSVVAGFSVTFQDMNGTNHTLYFMRQGGVSLQNSNGRLSYNRIPNDFNYITKKEYDGIGIVAQQARSAPPYSNVRRCRNAAACVYWLELMPRALQSGFMGAPLDERDFGF